jgi:hypothetical protein
VAPIILVGLTALSLEIYTNLEILNSKDNLTRLIVAKKLFVKASEKLSSYKGTCLYAAA